MTCKNLLFAKKRTIVFVFIRLDWLNRYVTQTLSKCETTLRICLFIQHATIFPLLYYTLLFIREATSLASEALENAF